MKSLSESLFDKDLIEKDVRYHPKTKDELIDCIKEQLDIQGPDANLNVIDVSKIKDMSHLFKNINKFVEIGNIDISKWDVSKVEDMSRMFFCCPKFNCDLSNWDVSKVRDMSYMFDSCLKFNCDLSKWNVSRVENMHCMFFGCFKFNCDLSKWNVGHVKDMDMECMFDHCISLKKIPDWYEIA